MKYLLLLVTTLTLAACASVPDAPPSQSLYLDARFAAPSERIGAGDVFALSPEMKDYVQTDLSGPVRTLGHQHGLFDALYKKGQLKLEYDGVMTKNASEAFAARSGNCLSLVIMTAAFAKEMGLPVRYQNVMVEETWSRTGDIYLSIGHVNLSLGRKQTDGGVDLVGEMLTIDFMPPSNLGTLRTHTLAEQTIVAMYMNNRAVESLTRDQLDDAYWWARAATVQDPKFLGAFNTLGVIYQRHGNIEQADRVFEYVLEREPGNTRVMSNLAPVLEKLGRNAEAQELTRKLQQLEPYPPFYFFKLGQEAMQRGDPRAAVTYFEREVERAAYYHEFHFWLAVAYASVGDADKARRQLTLAMENSATRADHDLYAAKLDRIRMSHLR